MRTDVGRSRLFWRLALVAAVLSWSLWMVYPPKERIKLGLDLNGGVSLVLRVKPAPSLARPDTPERHDEVVEQALRTIERRVNELGVAEPYVARYRGDDRILVELPGVADVEAAKRVIKSTAQLRLTLVERGPFADREAALGSYGGALPAGLELLPGPTGRERLPTVYVVHRAAVVSGSDLRDARSSVDEHGLPTVAFTLEPDAARRFGTFTAAHLRRELGTVVDGRVSSVATILSRIDDRGQIEGLSREEVLEQVVTLRSGALPADLEYVEERTIGASLGRSAVRSGIAASAAGLAFVVLFMLAYYRWAGLNAAASIVLNLLLLVACVAAIPAAVTLPGIAGLILTIGMGVDSNVLVFERLREEVAAGRGARAATRAAFDRVWLTIVDTHVTSLIAAALLFHFGTGPIRGFATLLTIGLATNVFTAVFASRTLFELALRRRGPDQAPWGLGGPRRPLAGRTIAVTRWSRHALALSLLVLAAGAVAVGARGLPLGIDFAGGTHVTVEFAGPGVTEEAVRGAVAGLPGDEIVQRVGPADERRFQVRLPRGNDDSGSEGMLDAVAWRVTQALDAADLPHRVVGRDLVSAAIGADLQQRGVAATAAALGAITAYLAIRFRPGFAIGAVVATLHDVLVTLACLALAGYDLTLNVVAALLTVIGYSVNDTIVIFDRVRENATELATRPLVGIVDLSVSQTLTRTLITAGTTLLSVLALYLFGGEALRGFAFTMLVGIASGTYSTIFVASAIAAALSGRGRRAPHRRLTP